MAGLPALNPPVCGCESAGGSVFNPNTSASHHSKATEATHAAAGSREQSAQRGLLIARPCRGASCENDRLRMVNAWQ